MSSVVEFSHSFQTLLNYVDPSEAFVFEWSWVMIGSLLSNSSQYFISLARFLVVPIFPGFPYHSHSHI